jgi:hypothetical protein
MFLNHHNNTVSVSVSLVGGYGITLQNVPNYDEFLTPKIITKIGMFPLSGN